MGVQLLAAGAHTHSISLSTTHTHAHTHTHTHTHTYDMQHVVYVGVVQFSDSWGTREDG